MPPPLDPDKREAIAQAIRDGGKRNEVARQFEVSPSTVTTIAKNEGIDGAFDRTATKRATEARNADTSARRAALKGLLVEDAHRLRAQLWQPCVMHNFGGKDNTHNSIELPQPTFEQQRNIMTSVGIAVQRVADLEKLDMGGGVEEAAGLIRDLVDSIRGG
jgi:transposase-like protein